MAPDSASSRQNPDAENRGPEHVATAGDQRLVERIQRIRVKQRKAVIQHVIGFNPQHVADKRAPPGEFAPCGQQTPSSVRVVPELNRTAIMSPGATLAAGIASCSEGAARAASVLSH